MNAERLTETAIGLRAEIAALEAEKAVCRTRRERRPINQRIHYLRSILRTLDGMAEHYAIRGACAHAREGQAHG